jgi:hypothetical protein
MDQDRVEPIRLIVADGCVKPLESFPETGIRRRSIRDVIGLDPPRRAQWTPAAFAKDGAASDCLILSGAITDGERDFQLGS